MSEKNLEDQDHNDTSSKTQPKYHIVANYVLGKTIGKGFFAKVKRAEDVYKQVYAVKCFDKTRINQSAHSLKQVEKEINALRLCNHPNVVQFHEVLEVEDTVYLVMEYVPQGELFDYILKRTRLSESEAVYLAKQIVSAVAYMHHAGIVHRDLKPENILIDANRRIKIVDFGLSSFYFNKNYTGSDSAPLAEDVNVDVKTRANSKYVMLQTQCGSPHYAAPEVLLGHAYYGPAADIWSLGVLIYAMVCGSLPFTADSIPKLIQKIVSGIYRFPSYLSENVRNLIVNLLRNTPTHRLTIDEVLVHPWFTETPEWVPPPEEYENTSSGVPSLPDADEERIEADSEIFQQLRAVASKNKDNKEKRCANCHKLLTATVTSGGMIKLHPVAEEASDAENSSSDGPSPSDDLCRCTNPIWHHSAVDPNLQRPSSSAFPSTSSSAAFWVPNSNIDILKTAPSDREYELMMAAESGNLAKVEEILNSEQLCPLIASKAYKAFSKINTSTQSTTENSDLTSSTTITPITPLETETIPENELYSTLSTSNSNRSSTSSSTTDVKHEKSDKKGFFTIRSLASRFSLSNDKREKEKEAVQQQQPHVSVVQPDNVDGELPPDNGLAKSLQDVLPGAFEDWRLRGTCACPDQRHRLDLRVRSSDNWSVLHYAARNGNPKILQALISSCLPLDIDCQTKSKWTPLMMAADKGHSEAVEILLRFRADIHTVSVDGKTAIFLARERNYLDISKRLTKASSERYKHTLIHGASSNTTIKLTGEQENLLKNVANANASKTLDTEVKDTTSSDQLDTLSASTSSSSTTNSTVGSSKYSATPMQAELVSACETGDVVKLKRVLNHSVQVIENQRALITKMSNPTNSPALPVPECDIFAKGIDNWTIFHAAARKGQTSAILFIIETLAAVQIPMSTILDQLNAVTKNGWTALMMATDRGFLDTVKLLVNNCGVDVDITAPPNYSALSLALEHGNTSPYNEIVSVLRKASKNH